MVPKKEEAIRTRARADQVFERMTDEDVSTGWASQAELIGDAFFVGAATRRDDHHGDVNHEQHWAPEQGMSRECHYECGNGEYPDENRDGGSDVGAAHSVPIGGVPIG